MAREKTLEQLIEDLRHELGKSIDPAVGRNEREYLAYQIRTTQERLFDEFDWPLKQTHADKALAAGSRYYDWPATIDPEGVETIELLWGDQYQPLEFGIGAREYSAYNSDSDERSDPALRWDFHNGDQFEIWPLPATAGSVRIYGKGVLPALTADADRAALDSLLILYSAAADILGGRKGQRDRAAVMEKRAIARGSTLKSRFAKKKKISFARGGSSGVPPGRRPTQIVVVSSS